MDTAKQLYASGRIEYNNQNYKKAYELFTESLHREDHMVTRQILSYSASKIGKRREATALAVHVLRSQPDNVGVLLFLVEHLIESGHPKMAAYTYRKFYSGPIHKRLIRFITSKRESLQAFDLK